MIEVIEAGRLTSIQDRGRPGLERFGVPPGGAADWFAAAVANRLVGNQGHAALLEVTAIGPTLRFHRDATIGISGGEHSVFEESAKALSWRTSGIPAGSLLRFGQVGPGFRSYIAIRGGIDVPIVLASRSLCARGGFGGGFGRPLRTGDLLAVGDLTAAEPMTQAWPSSHRLANRGPWEVRVIAGPHTEAFGPDALDRLSNTACLVTPAIDRMGLRLQTPALHLQPHEIVTTPVCAGAIQLTPSGELIVLLADHPTTGGYPVIATTISADLPLLAQARPGDTVRFRRVDASTAAMARRRLLDWLKLGGENSYDLSERLN
jgi:antagonist of KipI